MLGVSEGMLHVRWFRTEAVCCVVQNGSCMLGVSERDFMLGVTERDFMLGGSEWKLYVRCFRTEAVC